MSRWSPRRSISARASAMGTSGPTVGRSVRAYARAGSDGPAASGSSSGAIAPAKRPPAASSAVRTRGFRNRSRSSATLLEAEIVFGRRTMTSRPSRSCASTRASLPLAHPGSVIAGILGTLDDHGRRLDDRGRRVAGLEAQLIGALARHQRHDAVVVAGDLDLGHDPVALHRDHRAGETVARAGAARPRALGE